MNNNAGKLDFFSGWFDPNIEHAPAEALYWLGTVLLDQGQREAAQQAISESQAISHDSGHQWLYALALVTMGYLAGQSDPAASCTLSCCTWAVMTLANITLLQNGFDIV